MSEKDYSFYIIGALVVISLAFLAYCPHGEKEVFNKFRDPNTPPATYLDAVFSELRITAK